MSERTSYEPGVPSWVDLSSPDTDASATFYGGLFGWELQSAGPVEETGGYGMFTLRGKQVAGVGPIMQEGQPPAWSVYVATDDADASAERAAAAGGSVLVDPMDVMDAGRMAVFAHPAAGVLGVWQSGRHTGAVDGAKVFGQAVFGWKPEDQDFGGMTYTLFNVGGTGVAGAMTTPSQVPDEVPAFWLSYFTVEDCDAAVAKVQELGGRAFGAPHSLEGVGRFAVVADPHGATFGVIAGEPPDE